MLSRSLSPCEASASSAPRYRYSHGTKSSLISVYLRAPRAASPWNARTPHAAPRCRAAPVHIHARAFARA
eukprot:6043054-Prymnesium_polylepis.2